MKRVMSTVILVLAALGLTVAFGPEVAWAQNSHFVRSGTVSVDNAGNLVCSGWKIAGLGSNVTDEVTCSAQATAIYACINGGGHHPSATNKETVNGPVSGGDEFTSGKNGTISGSVTVGAPGAGTFNCPNGQTLTLASVSYSSIALADSFGATADVAGSAFACLLSGSLANDETLCP